MKPLIFILCFFICVCAGAQGRFAQATYVNHSQSCNVVSVTEQDFIMNIDNDSSVEFKMIIKYYGSYRNARSFSHTFLGKSKLNGDTLSIIYTSSSSTQTPNKKSNPNYMPTPNERIFYPPRVFVICGGSIRDLNSDFPVLTKVSPAIAMNMPQPK